MLSDPAPGVGAGEIAVVCELVGTRSAFLERFVAVGLQHQGGGAPDYKRRSKNPSLKRPDSPVAPE